jgi:hypothetical protein
MSMDTVRHTVEVSSDSVTPCEHCPDGPGSEGGWGASVVSKINHYIESHGYRLLHLGTETTMDGQGRRWHNAVAILGRDEPMANRGSQ